MTATDVLQRLVDTFGQAIEDDEAINGGDAVQQIVEICQAAKEVLAQKAELAVDMICDRLLDSEEHACEAAVPPVAHDAVVAIRALSDECGRLEARLQDIVSHRDEAALFMDELLASVETLTGVADVYGARTLADLMYLHAAIADGGFIDHHPGESRVLDVVRLLPSGVQWTRYVNTESAATADVEAPSDRIDNAIAVPRAVLALLIDMGRSHVEDIESGIEDGTYGADENTDIGTKRDAVGAAEALYRRAVTGDADAVKVSKLLPASPTGGIPGGDENAVPSLGRVWWIADTPEEAERWAADYLAKGAANVEPKPRNDGTTMVDVIITLERARADAIFGYPVEEEEFLSE